MKKILSVILLAALALSLLCTPAGAEGTETQRFTAEDFIYILKDDGTAEITGYTGSAAKLAVPSSLDGHEVTSVGFRAFYQNNKLTQVEIPDTVKAIGGYCFEWCEKLQSVALPEGLESIGSCAFYYCRKLSKVNLPDSLKKVGEGLFAGCKALKEAALSPDHPVLAMTDGVLFNQADSVLLWYPVPRKGKEYEIPDGTKEIGCDAFYETNLEKVVIPGSVERIAGGAFSDCNKLKTVNIPAKVTEADNWFRFCDRLEAINVDEGNEGLESVDGVLFDKTARKLVRYPSAKKDKTYTIPEGTEIIGDHAFDHAVFTEITIPDSVRIIGSNAFLECEKLKELNLPEGVTELGSYAFQFCSSLTKAVLPASLEKLNGNPFLSCAKLTSIEIAEGNTALTMVNGFLVQEDGMVLLGCVAGIKEKKLEFPAGIRKVESSAFGNCTSVEEVVFGDGLEEIAGRAFGSCKKLKRVVLPESLAEISTSAFEMNHITKTVFVVSPGSKAEEFCNLYGLKTEYPE